jgi:hypothetical protein
VRPGWVAVPASAAAAIAIGAVAVTTLIDRNEPGAPVVGAVADAATTTPSGGSPTTDPAPVVAVTSGGIAPGPTTIPVTPLPTTSAAATAAGPEGRAEPSGPADGGSGEQPGGPAATAPKPPVTRAPATTTAPPTTESPAPPTTKQPKEKKSDLTDPLKDTVDEVGDLVEVIL